VFNQIHSLRTATQPVAVSDTLAAVSASACGVIGYNSAKWIRHKALVSLTSVGLGLTTYSSGLTTNTQLASCLLRYAAVVQIRINVTLSSDPYALSHSVPCCFLLLLHPHPLCAFQIQFAYSGSCDFLVPSSSYRARVQTTLRLVPYSAVHGF